MTQSSPRVTLGIGGLLGHDGNAALLVDGSLVAAAQEERFTRIKHDGSFPFRAIDDCLNIAGLKSKDVQNVIFAEKGLQSQFFNQSHCCGNILTRWLVGLLPEGVGCLYHQQARALIPQAKFQHAWHHLSHVVGYVS